jgi:hypothetical protein
VSSGILLGKFGSVHDGASPRNSLSSIELAQVRNSPASSPLSHLLPCLDQALDGPSAGETSFVQAARAVRLAIEILNVLRAQQRQAPLEFLQIFLAQNFFSLNLGAAAHSPRILSNSLFVRLCGKLNNHGQTGREKAIRKRDDALPRLRAWEGACIARGRGDVSLDACLLRWRECVATCFDFWNIAGQCAKENRFEGGDLQEFSVASGKGTQQPPFPFSGADEELDQLTSPAMAHLSHLAARR